MPRSPDNPFNLRAVVHRVYDDLLWANRLERFQTFSQDTLSRCLSDTRDKILSDEDWMEEDRYLAD